jgi:hypothetical protein
VAGGEVSVTAPYGEEDGTLFPGYADLGDDTDPDELLAELRSLTDRNSGSSFARLFDLLDTWISRGNPLPVDWARPWAAGRRSEETVQVRRERDGEPPLLLSTR